MTADVRERLRSWLLSGNQPQPEGPADAADLALAARTQGLASRLDAALTAAPDDPAWPQPARTVLREAHRAAFLHGSRLLSMGGRVQRLLGALGLRSLPLKGVALAAAGCVEVAERPMVDLDLLLLDDWDRAVGALASAGFQPGEAADHALGLRDSETGELLELHHSVTSCPGLFPLDREGLWQRRREASSGLWVPAGEDLLVLGALHAAFQHGLVLPLVHYLDFQAVWSQPSFDASLAMQIAARGGSGLAVRVALDASAAAVGAAIPGWLRSRLPTPHPSLETWLAARLQDPLSLLPPSAPALARVRWELARGRRRALIRSTLAPACPLGSAASLVQRGGMARAWDLAWRWGLSSARTWRVARAAEKGTRV